VILLDTHALIWLDEANPRLGPAASKEIDDAFHAGALTVSAISFREVGALARQGRIRLDMDLAAWRQDLVGQGLIHRHRRSLAMRAPSAIDSSLAKTISGSTAPNPANVEKPQSVPAMTRSRPVQTVDAIIGMRMALTGNCTSFSHHELTHPSLQNR